MSWAPHALSFAPHTSAWRLVEASMSGKLVISMLGVWWYLVGHGRGKDEPHVLGVVFSAATSLELLKICKTSTHHAHQFSILLFSQCKIRTRRVASSTRRGRDRTYAMRDEALTG